MTRKSTTSQPIVAIVAADRATVVRDGAQLSVRSLSGPLSEDRARCLARHALARGERLLDCIRAEPAPPVATDYTFIVWPRTPTHTRRLLAGLPPAA